MTQETIPIIECECGWPRPLIAVTRTDGEKPTEDLYVVYDCPQCGCAYVTGERPLSTVLGSPRARKLADAFRRVKGYF